MRIRIKADKVRLWLIVPNAIISSRLGYTILERAYLRKHSSIRIQEEQRKALAKQWRRLCKNYKGTVLVDMQTKEGEIVKIVL